MKKELFDALLKESFIQKQLRETMQHFHLHDLIKQRAGTADFFLQLPIDHDFLLWLISHYLEYVTMTDDVILRMIEVFEQETTEEAIEDKKFGLAILAPLLVETNNSRLIEYCKKRAPHLYVANTHVPLEHKEQFLSIPKDLWSFDLFFTRLARRDTDFRSVFDSLVDEFSYHDGCDELLKVSNISGLPLHEITVRCIYESFPYVGNEMLDHNFVAYKNAPADIVERVFDNWRVNEYNLERFFQFVFINKSTTAKVYWIMLSKSTKKSIKEVRKHILNRKLLDLPEIVTLEKRMKIANELSA